MRLLSSVLFFFALGCSVPPLDVGEKRACPCAPGWKCDEAKDECVVFIAPDVGAPDLRPGVQVLDAQVPDAIIPDAIIPDVLVPDAMLVDGDLVVPDASVPDAIIPDAIIPDAIVPDALIPDALVPDADIPDMNIPDANVPDMSVPDAMVTSCPSGALICEDFETLLDRWDRYLAPGASMVQDDSRANRGQQSLRFDIGTGNNAELRYNHSNAIFSGSLYVKMYVYIPDDITQNFAFLAHKEGAAPWHGMSANITQQHFSLSNYNSSNDGYADSRPDTFPRNRWVCVTVATRVAGAGQVSGSAGGLNISVQADTLPQTGIVQTSFGVIVGGSHPAFSIWIDDIVIDRSPLACP